MNMNASKLFVSTIATVAVVGTIGFAYAQTGNYNSSSPNPQPQNQTTTPDQSRPATVNPNLDIQQQSGSTGAMNRDSTSNTASGTRDMSKERIARADRN
jgi:hypothetical protein